jgi:type I restriction enzyme S subunit
MKAKLDINNLDKTGWKKFRFEEIAQKISETVDPNTTDLKTYVGLEHIDPEDLHIKRFGTPEDVSGGKLKCYPGDVIFGKRRAYQRKAAIVDFEGICSAHAFVFRANAKVIDPKLFPFFLHSDQFMHRAVDISVGGLSPTINWGDLKHQEFLLPPKEEQAKLADLLWAMDDVIEKVKESKLVLYKFTQTFKKSFFKKESEQLLNFFHHKEIKFASAKIKDIAITSAGGTPSTTKKEYWENGDVSWINSGKLKNEIISSPSKYITKLGLKNSSAKLWPAETPVIALTGATTGEVGYLDFECSGNQSIVAIQTKGEILSKYIFFFLIEFKNKVLKQAIGSAQPHINKEIVDNLTIEFPNINIQKDAIKIFEDFVDLNLKFENKISASLSLQKSLINQIF